MHVLFLDNWSEPKTKGTIWSTAHVMTGHSILELNQRDSPIIVCINSFEKFLKCERIKCDIIK